MGGGGTTYSTTRPQIPPELSGAYGAAAGNLEDFMGTLPLTDFLQMDPLKVAGMSDAEKSVMQKMQKLMGGQPSATKAAQKTLNKLRNPTAWQAPEGVGAFQLPGMEQYGLGGLGQQIPGREAPITMPGQIGQIQMQDQIGREQMPGQIGDVLTSMDFAKHPALQSAMETFEATAMPGIANQMGAAGLGRSGAAGEAIAKGKAQMALPVMQNLMNLTLQQKGMDIGQRGQDIQSGLTQRGQDIGMRGGDIQALLGQRGQDIGQRAGDINALLAGRGQDVTQRGQDIQGLLSQMGLGLQARGQDIQGMLGGRGQDIQQLLGLGGLGLQARGQDLNTMLQSAAQLAGIGGQDINRIMGAGGALAGLGRDERDILDRQFGADYDEQMRQYGLGRFPYEILGGQLPNMIGTQTTQRQGGK